MSFDVKKRISKLVNSAKQRGIFVNLDANKYQLLIDQGCHYCGSSLSKESGYCLDRLDSNKGYTLMNVVGCCKICNYAKRSLSFEEFISWIQRASKHVEFVLKTLSQEPTDTQFNDDQLFISVYKDECKDKPKQRIYYNPFSKENKKTK